jgi:hypothetical protein
VDQEGDQDHPAQTQTHSQETGDRQVQIGQSPMCHQQRAWQPPGQRHDRDPAGPKRLRLRHQQRREDQNHKGN